MTTEDALAAFLRARGIEVVVNYPNAAENGEVAIVGHYVNHQYTALPLTPDGSDFRFRVQVLRGGGYSLMDDGFSLDGGEVVLGRVVELFEEVYEEIRRKIQGL